MAVRVRITSIPLMFLLLCSALLATTLQGVQGEVEVEGPSESECRPYIEKALKKLETGDTQSADVQDDDITHIVTTDDSDTESGDEIETIEPRSVEDETQEVEDEQNASEKDTESVEIENVKEDADDTGETQEVSAEEKGEREQAEDASEEKEAATEETAESVEKEASVEGEETEEQKSAEEETTDEISAQQEATASAEEGAASTDQEETEPSAEEGAASVEQEEDAVSVEQKEGAASVEQEEGEASAEHDGAASTEQVEEGPVIIEDVASTEQEEVASSPEEGATSAEQESAGSTEQAEGVASAEETTSSVEEKTGASGEQTEPEEGAASTEEGAASAEQEEVVPSAEEGTASAEQETAASAEDSAASADTEETALSAEKGVASAEQEEDAEKGVASAEQETGTSAEQEKDAASIEQEEGATSAEQEGAVSVEQEGTVLSAEEAATSTEQAEPEAAIASGEQTDSEPSAEKDAASVEKDEDSPEQTGSTDQAKETASAEDGGEMDPSGEDKTESVEKEKSGDKVETESSENEQTDNTISQEIVEESEAEPTPEEDLTWEVDIPSELRPRDHLNEILDLNDEPSETNNVILKAAEKTLNELKRIYENAIKPLETLYKYRDLSNRHFGDPEIFSKPLVLFMGPWSGGKSSIINYLLDNEYTQTSLRTGAEPSPAYFNLLMWGEEPEVLDGTQLAADWTFSGLQKFGQGLEERLRGLKLPNKLLEKINIVEIPGILEVRKQVSRMFPFNDACQWFIDRADIIFLVYDPSKLDVGPETEAILDQLKGREYQTRIILNKADQVKPEELMRVQGALIWNISPLMSSAQPPVMYSTSLWSKPYELGAPIRLLHAQERAFLKDLKTAIDKRIDNKIASARRFAVRVRNHAKMVDCYLTTYYNHKSVFGNKKLVSDQIIEHPQDYHIYEGLSTLTNISRYDLPDPDVYRDFFRLNPLYDFQQLSATCTYFRGCPINRLDVAIAYDLPELVGKYKKLVESVTNNADSSTKS